MTSPLIPIKIAAGSEGGIVNGEVTEGSAGEDYTMVSLLVYSDK
jgi:hypothetical protein